MKIAMLTGSFLPKTGGMEFVIHYLSLALIELGHEVVVFTKKTKDLLDLDNPYELITYGYTNIPFSGRSGLDAYSAKNVICKYNEQSRIDVMHCHSVSHTGSIALFVKKYIGVPLVMTPHGEDIQKFPEINYGIRLDDRWDKIVTDNLVGSDAVTTISESIEIDIPEQVSKEKIFRVPNGVNISRFEGEKSNYLHDRLNIDSATKVVLSVGRNHIKKGYEYGIEAFAKSNLHASNRVKYVVIGGGVNKLASFVSSLGMNSHVYLIESIPQDELAKAYRSATLFLSPSITEGLSMVSIEALAAGVPILATDVPGNRDIVNESKCGVLVPSRDIEKMAEEMSALLLDDEKMKIFNALARKSASRYSWLNIAKEYLEIYEKVISH